MPDYIIVVFNPLAQAWEVKTIYTTFEMALYNWNLTKDAYVGQKRELRVCVTLLNSESTYT